MFVPCPSCKAELSPALVGADGRCPYCGTKAVEDASPAVDRFVKKHSRPLDEDDPPPKPTRPSAKPAPAEAPPVAVDPEAVKKLPPGWGGLTVGSRGILFGKPASVTGRIRFVVERPRTIAAWDAWQMQFADGGDGWLLDREGSLAIVRPYKIVNAVEHGALREGGLVRLDAGPPATVVDLGTAYVRGLEGTVDLVPGARVRYATLAGAAWRYHLEWKPESDAEAFRGERIEPAMLAAGFGLRVPHSLKDSAASSFEWLEHLPITVQIALVLLAIPLIAGIGLMVVMAGITSLFK